MAHRREKRNFCSIRGDRIGLRLPQYDSIAFGKHSKKHDVRCNTNDGGRRHQGGKYPYGHIVRNQGWAKIISAQGKTDDPTAKDYCKNQCDEFLFPSERECCKNGCHDRGIDLIDIGALGQRKEENKNNNTCAQEPVDPAPIQIAKSNNHCGGKRDNCEQSARHDTSEKPKPKADPAPCQPDDPGKQA